MNSIKNLFKGDKVIWIIIVLFSIMSILTVYSSTGALAYKDFQGDTMRFLIKHGGIMIIGIGIIILVQKIPVSFYFSIGYILLFIGLGLLFLTLLSGENLNSASRWMKIPFTSLTFQSSDVAKLALIAYLAKTLSDMQKDLTNFKQILIRLVAPIGAMTGLVITTNLSTALLICISSFFILYVGRVSYKHLGYIVGLAVIVLVFGVGVMYASGVGRAQTWVNRIENFSSGDGDNVYQIEQAKIAVVSGGLIGRGVGKSVQRNFLPHSYSDFIYAIIIEEWGAIMASFVLVLYVILLNRVGRIIRRCKSAFSTFLVLGLILNIMLQAFINMAVAVDLMPVTGQTLPLISMGGTSVLITCATFGIILRVSEDVSIEELKKFK